MICRVASFDVYDTTITRLVGKPTSLFLLLAGEVKKKAEFSSLEEIQFMECRARAEQKAYISHGAKGNLNDVYRELEDMLHLPSNSLFYARQKERELEKRFSVGIPITTMMIDAERARGRRIAFLSDMYLPAEDIRQILVDTGVYREGDILLVSNEEGQDKTSTTLFRRLSDISGVACQYILHRGDNENADFLGAKGAGCKSMRLEPAKLNRYELIMEEYALATCGFSSFLAGISRAVRISHPNSNVRDSTITSVAAGVAAPILIAYVHWILTQSVKLKLKRLYFVSRDGEVLLEIARKIVGMSRAFSAIELRYLYGSRHAWYPASIETCQDIEDALSTWLTEGFQEVTFSTVFARLNISLPETEQVFARYSFLKSLWNEKIYKNANLDRLKALLQDPQIENLIFAKASSHRANVLSYLKQEGLAERELWGYVDLGWRGRMQQKLAKFVLQIDGIRPEGFYYALTSMPDTSAYGGYHVFSSHGDPGALSCFEGLAAFMETMCSGSHGVVLGYEKGEKGTFIPVLKEAINNPLQKWGLSIYRKTLDEYCEYMQKGCVAIEDWRFEKEMLYRLLKKFWLEPSANEARVWGDFPISSDPLDAGKMILSSPIEFQNIIGEFLPYSWGYRIQSLQTQWWAGSYNRTSFSFRALLRIIQKTASAVRVVLQCGRYLKHKITQR
ncbi:MAG: hypothetical protein LBJ36_07640 [Synergistaceae bacterium]|jgi:FMN phosphatase YigB (HAD superfamily)|nr:hypothetical protein [Synergistaceae bacterium]